MDWMDCERLMKQHAFQGKAGNRAIYKGIYKEDYSSALAELGWHWCSAPKFVGRKARASDLTGTVIAQMAGHYCAVVDGVTQDTWDCSHKMVYGYWKAES